MATGSALFWIFAWILFDIFHDVSGGLEQRSISKCIENSHSGCLKNEECCGLTSVCMDGVCSFNDEQVRVHNLTLETNSFGYLPKKHIVIIPEWMLYGIGIFCSIISVIVILWFLCCTKGKNDDKNDDCKDELP